MTEKWREGISGIKPAKNRQKTGTDAKVTEYNSAGCWQKWQKKIKSAGFVRENETFLAGEAKKV